MPNPSYWYYLTYSEEDNRVHTFPKGICTKGNVIARLEFELVDYEFIVQHVNHYATSTTFVSCTWLTYSNIFITTLYDYYFFN